MFRHEVRPAGERTGPDGLPVTLPALSAQLTGLARQVDAGKALVVRARLRDGSTVEGMVNNASPDHVSIFRSPRTDPVTITAAQLAGLELSRTHPAAKAAAIGGAILFMATPFGFWALGASRWLGMLGMVPVIAVLLPLLRRLHLRLRRWEPLLTDQ